MDKICEMESVREWNEHYPVELGRNSKSGRLVIRAQNEGGNNLTEVDLWDLLHWFIGGPRREVTSSENDLDGGGGSA
jgi:hypothetical protein